VDRIERVTQARANQLPLVSPGTIEHHIADLSATFSADVTLAAAQVKLREQNQWLPIDGNPARTLGELVECNSTGPMRLGFGAWRDLLLGVQFENGAGELITAGGRTVKNVAGYDLTKFMVGQFGIFGKIITLTTRTYKAPDEALLAGFSPDLKTFNALMVSQCRPQWAAMTKEALLCGYLGDRITVNFYEADLREHRPVAVLRKSLDEEIEFRAQFWHKPGPLTFRASVPPAKILDFAQSIGDEQWVADPAFGIVIGSCEVLEESVVQRAAERVGGTMVTFDSSGRPRNLKIDPALGPLLERLKSAFDADGKLSPLPIDVA
jgi:hypothetical protein